MHGFRWNDPRLVLSLVLGVMARDARAENLRDAWTIALGTNAAAPGQSADVRGSQPGAGLFTLRAAASDPDAQRPGIPL